MKKLTLLTLIVLLSVSSVNTVQAKTLEEVLHDMTVKETVNNLVAKPLVVVGWAAKKGATLLLKGISLPIILLEKVKK